MKDLEQELGKKLFRRGSAGLSLTDEGMLLRKRAEDIVDMVDKTAGEFAALDDIAGGEAHIGCAESYQIRYLARTIRAFKKNIRCSAITSPAAIRSRWWSGWTGG